MVQLLSKKIVVLALLVCSSFSLFSQADEDDNKPGFKYNASDYKEPKQFEKFTKRKNQIASWQISQLRDGAMVVRLKTNKKLIDALTAEGNTDMARQKRLEQFAINKNTMFAYIDNLKFCKVYFIYSNSSDSLLNGAKSGIFLDTNLTLDPKITMNENFYMIAERDYAYNSSIGFVPEDSAKLAVEHGNPIKEMAVVIKNKYGHQVKGPFPYYVKEKSAVDAYYNFPIDEVTAPGGGTIINFSINKTYLQDLKDPAKKGLSHAVYKSSVKIKKEFTYERISAAVDQLNDYLNQFYRVNPRVVSDRPDSDIKPFLY